MKTTILLAGLGGLMVAIGSLFGRGGAIIGLALGLLLVGFSYWKSDSLAIRAARAVPADEAQLPRVLRHRARAGRARPDMPMPRLYISPEQQPNAFATGRNPEHAAVAVTEGLLAACTWDEIRGVLAHELCTSATATSSSARWPPRSPPASPSSPTWRCGAPCWAAEAATTTTAATRSRSWPPPSWRPSPPGCSRWPCPAAASSRPTARGAELIGTGAPLAQALQKLEAYAARGADGHRAGAGPGVHRQPAHGPRGAASRTCSAPTRRRRHGSSACGP